jgi:hypothetical protein
VRAFQPVPFGEPSVLPTPDSRNANFLLAQKAEQSQLPPSGMISHFQGIAASWKDPSIIDGKPWHNHHAGRAWSLTKLDDLTLRMEVRQGDPEAIDVGGERSEISGPSFPGGTEIDFSYRLMIEPGSLNQNPRATWLALTQFHGASRPAVLNMIGEHMGANINLDHGGGPGWRDIKPVERGRWYDFRWQLRTGNPGYVRLWRDNVQVLNFSGNVVGTSNYPKLGIYRGWNGKVPQTMAVRISNIRMSVQ